MTGPTPEDFYARTPVGQSALQRFVRELPLNVPTLPPAGLSKASTLQGQQGAFSSAARVQKMMVKTIIRDGAVWVMRIA